MKNPILIALFFVNFSILMILFRFFPMTLELTFGKGAWWLSAPESVRILYVGIIAPVVEEFFFRRTVLDLFIKTDLFKVGLAISSVLFGLWHLVVGWGY